MRFGLFVLANAMLFIRPSELLPELGDFELYRYVIVACLFVSLPVVVQQVFARVAGVPPVAGCVIGLFPAVILSHVSHGNGEEALEQGIEFFKVLIYFLLLIGLITTTTRLRQLLYWLGLFCAVLTVVAVLRYHTDLSKPEPPPPPPPPTADANADAKQKKAHGTAVIEKVRDPKTDELVDVPRMCGTGIFNDPNDLALVLITAIPLCLYWLTDPQRKALRPVWIGLILLFGYALMLTHSRGGLLALMAGLAVLLHMRYGGAKTVMLGMLLLPALLAVFAGRMTSISASEGTGQSRIQLWSDGLVFFQQAPLFGIGMDGYRLVATHVAHNSYIHCYAELGILGGTLFVGAFYFAVHGLYRLRVQPAAVPTSTEAYNNPTPAEERPVADPELERLHPYLMAMIVAYAVGIAFLSRSYIVPTYLLLGLAVVYLRLRSSGVAPKWCKLAWVQLAGVSVCFLMGAYVFVRMFVNWQ
jgi:hypothetical protein